MTLKPDESEDESLTGLDASQSGAQVLNESHAISAPVEWLMSCPDDFVQPFDDVC